MPNPLDTLYDQLKGQYPDLVDRSEFIGKLSNEDELKKLHDAASKDIPGFVDFDNFKSKVNESLSSYDADSDYREQNEASTTQQSAPTDITIPRREKAQQEPSGTQNGGVASEAYTPVEPGRPTATPAEPEPFDRETGDLDELDRRYEEKLKRLEDFGRWDGVFVNEESARKHYEGYSKLLDEAEQDRLVYNRRVKAAEDERAEQQRQLDLQSKDRKTRRAAEYGGYTNDQVRKEQERLKKERAYLEDPKSKRKADYSKRVMEYNADQTALSGEADKRNKRYEAKRTMYDEVRKVAEDPDVQKRITGNETVSYVLSGNNPYALQNYDAAANRAKQKSVEELADTCKTIAGQVYARGYNRDIYAPLAANFMANYNELMYRMGGEEPKSALELRYDMIDKATEDSPEGDEFMLGLRNYLDGTAGKGTANYETDPSERANIPQFAIADIYDSLVFDKNLENIRKVEQLSRLPMTEGSELNMAAAATDINYDEILKQAYDEFGDEKLKEYICAHALRNGISIDESARRVNQSIWNATLGKAMDEYKPKSNLEFFMRRIFSDNMFSKLVQIGIRGRNGNFGGTDPFALNAMVLDEYAKDHPGWETGAVVFNFAVMEGPIFSGFGKAATGLVGVTERALVGAALKTTDKVAIEATARTLSQSLMYRLAKGGATGALVGFQYGTVSGTIDQAFYNGKVEFGKVLANGGHMMRDFALMHGVGELFGVTGDAILRRGQRNRANGQGAFRNRVETTTLSFLNNVAKTTTNAGIVTGLYAAIDKPALEAENKKIEAENKKIEAENARLPEDQQKPLKPLNQIASVEDTFYSTLKMFAGLDAVGMLRSAWSIGVRGEYERNKHVRVHFDKFDKEALEKAFGKNPNSLLRQIVFGNVDGVPAKWFEIDPEAESEIYKELGRELTPAEKEAYATYGFTELRKIILNKDIPWATRAKIVSVITGRVVQEPPVAKATIDFVMDSSGTRAKRIIVKSIDLEGNVIQAREFDGQREFEAARRLYESLNDRGWRNNAMLCGDLVIDAIEDKTYADTVDEMAREKGIAPEQFEQMVFGIKQKDITGEKVTYQERQLVDEFDKRHQEKQKAEMELARPGKLFEQVAREVFGEKWKRAYKIPEKSWGEMTQEEKEFVGRYIDRMGVMGVAERNKLMNANPDWARAAKEYEESVRRRMDEIDRLLDPEPLPALEDEKVSVEIPAEERVEPTPEVIELEEEKPAEPEPVKEEAPVAEEKPDTEGQPQAGTIGFEPVEQPTERERFDAERKAKAATITDADIEANREALGIPEGTALTDEARQIYAEDLAEDLMRYERFKRGESDEKARFHDYWESKFNPKRPKLEKPVEKQEEPEEEEFEEEEATEADALIEQLDNLKGRSDLEKYRNALTVFAGDDEIMAILEDLEPRDIYEWVSSMLGLDNSRRGWSMLWESKTRNGAVIAKGFKEETGWSWNDAKGFAFMFDNKNGMSPRRVAEKIWEELPSGMKDQYSDVDVFDIMMDLFKSSSRKSDLTGLIRNNRLDQVRDLLNRRRSDELEDIARYKERMNRGEEEPVAEPVAPDESSNEFAVREDDVAPFSLLSLNYRGVKVEGGTIRSRARTRKQIGTIAKALGYKIRWVADKSYNAKIDTDEKVLYLNIRTDQPLEAVMGHEITHDLRKSDPEAYEALKRYAKDLLGQEQWDSEVKDVTEDYNKEYKRRGWQPIRADKAEEEVVCDTMGKLLHSRKGLRELAGSLDPGVAGKVYRLMKDITDKIKSALGKEHDYGPMDSALQEFLESVEQRAKKQLSNQATDEIVYPIQGLDGYTEQDVLDGVRGDIEEKLENAGVDGVTIKGMVLHGSRMRGDARADSDLDVVVEYEGDISEDGLFNILNDEPMYLDGVKVDINPITRGKSGTLKQYMERSRRYDEEKLRDESSQNGTSFSLKREERDEDDYVPTFYSNAAKAVENVKQNKATAEQWKAMLTKAGGIKAGEDKWMGLSEWLDEHKGQTLTKEEVAQFVAENGIQMEEVDYQEGVVEPRIPEKVYEDFEDYYNRWTDDDFDTPLDHLEYAWGVYCNISPRWIRDSIVPHLYHDGTWDLRIADRNILREHVGIDSDYSINRTRLEYTTEGLENKREIAFVVPNVEPYQEYDEIHFGPENQGKAIMWVRFGETTDSEGKRVLVIDEVQSNRHQDAREKGYREDFVQSELDQARQESSSYSTYLFNKYIRGKHPGEDFLDYATDEEKERFWELSNKVSDILKNRYHGVPAAPFEKNWHEVAMKRMLRLAAEEGYAKLAWTTGGQQARRYDLGQSVKSIEKTSVKNDKGAVRYNMYDHEGWGRGVFVKDGIVTDSYYDFLKDKPLTEVVGKEIAEKMMSLNDGESIQGDDLMVGGEGMKSFYDKMLPSFMNKYGKRWGVKVGEVTLNTPGRETMHSVDINEDMRRSVVEQGQPLFSLKRDKERTLMGVHNITAEKLRSALKLGGLANPSMAVIDTKVGDFDNFGEISLIPASDLIASRTGRNAGTWGADAYSPRFPETHRRLGKGGDKKMRSWIKGLGMRKEMEFNTEEQFNDYYNGFNIRDNALVYPFLHEKGLSDQVDYYTHMNVDQRLEDDLREANGDQFVLLKRFDEDEEYKKKLTDIVIGDEIGKIRKKEDETFQQFRDRRREWAKEIRETLTEEDGYINRNLAEDLLYAQARAYRENGKFSESRTLDNAEKYIRDNGLQEEYQQYFEQKMQELGAETQVYAGSDSMGRSKFKPIDLESVSKQMKKQGRAGGEGGIFEDSPGAIRAKLLNPMKTLDQIRKEKGRIVSHDEFEQAREEYQDRLRDYADTYANGSIGALADILTSRDMAETAKQYNKDLDAGDLYDLNEFKDYVRALPTEYFETKFERPVGLEEFKKAVVPDNLPLDLYGALERAGLEIVEYPAGDREERQRVTLDAVKGDQDVLFSLMGRRGAARLDDADHGGRMDRNVIAEEMEEAGKDARTIKMATGWERGADNKWRYETPDGDFVGGGINVADAEQARLKLSDIWDSPELFKAYPEFAEIPVEIVNNPLGASATTQVDRSYEMPEYEVYEKFIRDYDQWLEDKERKREDYEARLLSYEPGEEMYELLSDVIKNITREIEDAPNRLARTKEIVADPDKIMYMKLYLNKAHLSKDGVISADAEFSGNNARQVVAHEIQHLIQETEGFASGGTTRDMTYGEYRRLAGETEARNVSRRVDMPEYERRRSLASDTEDVPRERQTVRYTSKTSESNSSEVYTDADGNEVYTETREDGTKDREITTYGDGSKKALWYDDKGNLKERLDYFPNGEVSQVANYDSDGNLTRHIQYDENKRITSYYLPAIGTDWKLDENGIARGKSNGVKIEPYNFQFSLKRDAQTHSENFKNWFGDWENDPENASKVVDENGRPLVVYHQTNAKRWINRETGEDWEKLDWRKKMEWENKSQEEWEDAWEEQDFYTFDDRYARQSIEMPAIFFSPENDPHHEYGERTIAAYLDIKNPAINPDIPNRGVTDTAGRDAMEALKAQGYDGFIRTDEDGNVLEYGVFSSNQIKSATENNGEFDPNNPDIRYSLKRRRNRDDYTDEDRADAAIIANTYLAQADALRQQIEADREREHQLVEERNRLLAFDYPAADPSDRPTIMDRINALRGQINDLRNANYENNTKLRSMDYEYRVAKEILEQGAVTDEEAARFDAGQMTREEKVLESLFKAAADSRADKKAKQKAIQGLVRELTAITDNFKAAMKARGIESQRKHYDKGTVDHIIRLARAMMNTGYIDNMTSYEVKRLMGMINNAATRESIEEQAGRIVDMMLDHQIKTLKVDFTKQLKVQGARENSSGVMVQAGLDQEGQVIMKSYRESMKIIKESAGKREIDDELTEWGEFYVKTLNDMGDADPVKAEQARKIFAGILLAERWFNDVRMLEINGRILRSQMEDFKASNKPDKTADKDTKQRYADALADYQEMLRQNKIRIIEAYERMTGEVGATQAESVRRAQEFAEAQKQRVNEIQHNANSDLEGVDDNTQVKTPESRVFGANKNNVIVRLLFESAGTYEKFMRFFGRLAPNGEGYLFKRFMTQYHHARQDYWKGRHSAFEEMDKKMAEVFGKKKMHWSDIYEMTRDYKKFPPITVSYWDGYRDGQPYQRMDELSQSEALYLYMINKMPDGRMKLRHMGITDDVVQQMAGQIDPKLIYLADWLQSEFLPKMRIKYNEVHKRVFGADMAAIEDYFPLRINKLSRRSDTDIANRDNDDNKPSTITGAIVKRRVNTNDIDLHTDAFDVALAHVDEMEHWSAFAEFNRDNNALVNYKRFRTKVSNLSSLEFGAGDVLLKNFTDAVAIAADAYHPKAGKRGGDYYSTRVAKFVSTAKIALRQYTALKQLLSLPAFWANSDPLEQMKATVNVANSWQWAIENLPGFAERWQSRQAGNIKLANYNDLSGLRRRKAMRKLQRAGMWANAAIDGLACAMGGKAVYETKLKRYRKMGYDDDVAKEKALIDAAIAYNNSQQSSEGAYVSTIQVDRTWYANAFSVFRSASMGYTRRLNTSLRQLRNATFKQGYGKQSVEFLKKQMMRDGLTEEQAEKWARKIYRRANLKAAASVAIFGQILPFFWNLGANMFYLLFGDDKKEKESILADSFRHSFFGPVEGLVGGNVISEIGDIAADTAIGKFFGDSVWGDSEAFKALGYRDFTTMPLSSDLQNVLKYFARDEVKAANEVVNILFQVATGVNPQTITDWVTAILDFSRSDMERRDIAMFVMRLLSTPQQQLDKFYLDQLNLSQQQASKMSTEDLIKRYATYKRWRETPLTGWWMYSDERVKEVEQKFQKRYEDMLDKRAAAEEGMREAVNNTDDLSRKRTMMRKLQKELADSIEPADPELYKKALEGEKADDDEYVRLATDKDVEQMAELAMKKKALRAAHDRKTQADKDVEAGRITQEEYDAIYKECAHEWKLYNYLDDKAAKHIKELKGMIAKGIKSRTVRGKTIEGKDTPEEVMDSIRTYTDKALQMRPEDMKMKKGDKKHSKKNKKK